MKPHVLLTVLLLPLSWRLEAQTPDLARQQLAAGISLAIPAHWVVSDSGPRRLLADSVREVLRATQNPTLAAGLNLTHPQILLVARGPAGASINLNVAAVHGLTPWAYDLSPAQLRERLQSTCSMTATVLARSHMTVTHCDSIQLQTVAHRNAVVIQYDREGSSGAFHIWLVQVPSSDALVSLALGAPRADVSVLGAVYERVWRSLALPDSIAARAPN